MRDPDTFSFKENCIRLESLCEELSCGALHGSQHDIKIEIEELQEWINDQAQLQRRLKALAAYARSQQ